MVCDLVHVPIKVTCVRMRSPRDMEIHLLLQPVCLHGNLIGFHGINVDAYICAMSSRRIY